MRDVLLAVTVDITPGEPLGMFGYHHRQGPFQRVRMSLEANVIGVCDENDRFIYLVSVDSLYGGEIGRRLAAKLNLRENQVIVLGSHTHFGVGVDSRLRELGETNVGYLEMVVDRVATAVTKESTRVAASASVALGRVEGLFVNRRWPTLGIGVPLPKVGRSITAPHRSASVDPMLRLAAMWSEGELVAILWGVSCHPVCSPDRDAISSCFPGAVREQLRNAFGDVPILFAQGFSGDVRPASISTRPKRSFRGFVQYILAGGEVFAPQGEAAYANWCSELADRAIDVLHEAKSSKGEALNCSLAKQTIPVPPGWERSPVLQHIRFTSRFSLLTVNAEVVNERVADLEEVFGQSGGITFPVGCCDEVIGYWPTDRMLRQGGYEAEGSACFFPQRDWASVGGPDRLWWRLLGMFREDEYSRRWGPAVVS